RMKRTVWNTGGCTSWYLDAEGRNTTVWPGTTGEFRRQTRTVDLAEYDVIRATGTPGVAAPGAAGGVRGGEAGRLAGSGRVPEQPGRSERETVAAGDTVTEEAAR
ncbi:cyclohexanone monooxygenase, partial [Streptomyces sp. DSM 41640]|nr:cyclohexanone monooxygenase [Streptomyces sp. DSM 41640]